MILQGGFLTWFLNADLSKIGLERILNRSKELEHAFMMTVTISVQL